MSGIIPNFVVRHEVDIKTWNMDREPQFYALLPSSMKVSHVRFFFVATTVMATAVLSAGTCHSADAIHTNVHHTNENNSEWVSLFNGTDLTGFDTFLGRYTDDQFNVDPANIVTVHDGVVHIYKDTETGSEVPFGYFATQKEYSHYHLPVSYTHLTLPTICSV